MLENLDKPQNIRSCKVRYYFDELDASDAELLKKYIADVDGWSGYALSSALNKRGVIISDKMINKHRNGLCTCKEYYARKP